MEIEFSFKWFPGREVLIYLALWSFVLCLGKFGANGTDSMQDGNIARWEGRGYTTL
jgi:hypothetical protein